MVLDTAGPWDRGNPSATVSLATSRCPHLSANKDEICHQKKKRRIRVPNRGNSRFAIRATLCRYVWMIPTFPFLSLAPRRNSPALITATSCSVVLSKTKRNTDEDNKIRIWPEWSENEMNSEKWVSKVLCVKTEASPYQCNVYGLVFIHVFQ